MLDLRFVIAGKKAFAIAFWPFLGNCPWTSTRMGPSCSAEVGVRIGDCCLEEDVRVSVPLTFTAGVFAIATV